MKIEYFGKIISGQDGAIFKDYLFRFDAQGGCSVYLLDKISNDSAPISQFAF